MGLRDKIRKFTEPENFDDDYNEYISQPIPVENRKTSQTTAIPSINATTYDQPATSFRGDKVVNINATAQLQVVLVKPDRFENAAEIADHLKDRKTVVINLEQTNKEIARRLLDFLSGVAYAYQGKFQKIANSTFLITPYNVGIMGDIIDELESNGLYF